MRPLVEREKLAVLMEVLGSQQELLDGLPGAIRIRDGLADLRAGRQTMDACLVRIARPRLSRAGLMPLVAADDGEAELELYQMLAPEGACAHSRFNALLRELTSFERALDHRLSAGRRKCVEKAFLPSS